MENTTPYDENLTTLAQFELWLKTSRPGDRFEYHRGMLANDRETVTMMPQGYYAHVFHEPMHDLGLVAYAEYERGNVTLVQQKQRPGVYRYFAIKRKGGLRVQYRHTRVPGPGGNPGPSNDRRLHNEVRSHAEMARLSIGVS